MSEPIPDLDAMVPARMCCELRQTIGLDTTAVFDSVSEAWEEAIVELVVSQHAARLDEPEKSAYMNKALGID